jgi:transcriptional regulator with XRE-family HTH domain
MEAGEALKEMLRQTKTTQAELAQKIGLKSQGGISSLVSRNNFNVSTLISIANALGYEVVLQSKKYKITLGEELLPEGENGGSDLEAKIENISEMVRELVAESRAEEAKIKKPSHGKIPLTAGTAADGQYYDPEWYMQEKKK